MRHVILAAALGLFLADLVVGPPVERGGALLVLAVGALVLELTAVPLPGFGHFSGAAACYLAAGLHPQIGSAGAAVLILLGLLVRILGASGKRPMESALSGAVPPLAAVLAPALWAGLAPRGLPPAFVAVPPLLALTVYLALEKDLPTRLARGALRDDRVPWMRLRRSLGELHLLVAATGVGAAFLSPWSSLLVIFPLLWATHRAAENTLFRVQAVAAVEAREQLVELQQEVDQVQAEALRVKRQLDLTTEQKKRLERFADYLARSPSLKESLELTVDTVVREIECRSAVVFLSPDGKRSSLHPAAFRSPAAERLREAELLGQREPLVDEAWTAARPLALSGSTDKPTRLLAGEKVAVAVPLRREGVLYLGRDREPFSQSELRRLLWLAETLALALAASRHHEDLEQALVRGEAERGQLKGQVALLSALVEGSQALASSLDPAELITGARAFLERVLPHTAGMIRWGGRHRCWGEPSLDSLAGAPEGPLLLPDLSQSPLGGELTGSLLIASQVLLHRARPFTEEELTLLRLYAYQLELALSRADQHRRLKESQAQLVEGSKMKAVGQLAAGVAHELNSPLGAIRLALDSALALPLEPAAARKRLERATGACGRAQKIVESLLIYSRGDEGTKERFPLAQVVRDTLTFLSTPDFSLEQRIETEAEVVGSCSELQQVLINLLLNAMDAAEGMPPERRRLVVVCEPDGDGLALRVRDFGPGVAPEARERLFEPFFTSKPVGRGTGLGLSVSREIAERHGGRLGVESAPGEGATFSLWLPRS